MLKPIAALTLLLLPLLAGAAPMYRWTDAQGQVHYTQTPPPGFNADKVAPAPPPSSNPGVEAVRKLNQTTDKAAKEGAAQQAEADLKKTERDGKCKQAQERVAFFEARTAHRIASKNEDGSLSRMTTEEYDKKLAEAREAVASSCN